MLSVRKEVVLIIDVPFISIMKAIVKRGDRLSMGIDVDDDDGGGSRSCRSRLEQRSSFRGNASICSTTNHFTAGGWMDGWMDESPPY